MTIHTDQKELNFTADQLFKLVCDVEQYEHFLPACKSCVITERINDNEFIADLTAGYKMFTETFTSRVTMKPDDREILVEYLGGPMNHLQNRWQFREVEGGSCLVDFYIDFQFKSPLFEKMIGAVFHEAVKRMITAFEDRAKEIYK